MTEAAFADALEKIYAVPLQEDLWPEALRSIRDLFGSPCAHFEIVDKATSIPVLQKSFGVDESGMEAYANYYAAISPRVADGLVRPEGHIGYDYMILSEAEMAKDEFYSDFMIPQDFKYFVSGHLMNNDRYFGVVSIQRRVAESHADKKDIALMERLLPHLRQTVQLQLKMAAMNDRLGVDDFLFEGSPTGVLFLDSRGCVVSMNSAAEGLINDPLNGLAIQRHRLSARDSRLRRKIDGLINDTIQTGISETQTPGRRLPVPREMALPLSIIANPLPNAGALTALTGGPVAVLLISDPGQAPDFPAPLLRALYGLTPAECKLVNALLSGQSVTDYADTHRVGIRTVRTHLSNVLHKTGAHNQAALVRLLGATSHHLM
jgi:DNA-binding CsgD family transcriptional regulator